MAYYIKCKITIKTIITFNSESINSADVGVGGLSSEKKISSGVQYDSYIQNICIRLNINFMLISYFEQLFKENYSHILILLKIKLLNRL